MLCQTLELVDQRSCRRSCQTPLHLVVVADNAGAGMENNYRLRFLAYVVAQNLLRNSTLFCLMVGHMLEVI